jgi:DUF2975 family protein
VPAPRALSLSRLVLRALVVANVLYGLGILALLVASLVAEGPFFTALGVKQAEGIDRMIRGGRLIMVVGIAAVPIGHLILARLLAIVDTVRAGDPFVVQNAARLQTIAWCVLGLEGLHLIIGAIAATSASSVQPLDIDWNFSVTPWIAVLLLFVLARVFDYGARMRADLEGTV